MNINSMSELDRRELFALTNKRIQNRSFLVTDGEFPFGIDAWHVHNHRYIAWRRGENGPMSIFAPSENIPREININGNVLDWQNDFGYYQMRNRTYQTPEDVKAARQANKSVKTPIKSAAKTPATKAPSAEIVAPCPVTAKAPAGSYASKTPLITKTTPRAGSKTPSKTATKAPRKAAKRPAEPMPPPAVDCTICQDFDDVLEFWQTGLEESWLDDPTPECEAKRKKPNERNEIITELTRAHVSPPVIPSICSISTSNQAAPALPSSSTPDKDIAFILCVSMQPVVPTLQIQDRPSPPEETVFTAPPPTTPQPPVLQERPLPLPPAPIPTFKFPPLNPFALPKLQPNPATFSTSQSTPRALSEPVAWRPILTPTMHKVSPPSPSSTIAAGFSPIRCSSPEVTQVVRPDCAPAALGQSRAQFCQPPPPHQDRPRSQSSQPAPEQARLPPQHVGPTHEANRPISSHSYGPRPTQPVRPTHGQGFDRRSPVPQETRHPPPRHDRSPLQTVRSTHGQIAGRPVSAPTVAEVQQFPRPLPHRFSTPAPLTAPLRRGSRVTVNQGTYRGCSGFVQEVGKAGSFTIPGQWNVRLKVGGNKMKVMLPETFLSAC